MLDHVLSLWVGVPCSVALIFAGAYCYVSAPSVSKTKTGTTIIETIPPRLRFARALALTGKVIMLSGATMVVVGLFALTR